MARLVDVDTIIHIKVSLSFYGNGHYYVNQVHEHVGGLGIRCRHSKIIALTHEEDAITIEYAGIETGLVYRWFESNFAYDLICVLLPQPG